MQRVIRNGDYSDIARHIGNTLLNINDIGGQPGFLEMLPALSTGPALYLVFFDLSKELNKPYKIPFSRDDRIITPYEAKHTVEATISQILSAIASVHCVSRVSYPKINAFSEKFEKFQNIKPAATLIGTHRDKLDNPEDIIIQINKVLKEITQKFSETVISSPKYGPSFQVDNFSGTEESDIGPLRDFINKIFCTHFKKASLPVCPKWLIFGTMLRREYKIVSMDDCLELGKMLEMDKEEIDICLWYLDCIGTLMRYTNIIDDEDNWFKNHVICFPQVIFDSISQLIVASLYTLHSEGYVIDCEREELIKRGQFSMESIEKYCYSEEVTKKLKDNDLIPAKQLIKLLKHVNLLSPIIHKEPDGSERVTYLLPAVLECASPEELTTPPQTDTNNPQPLHITFTYGYVPTGTFCGLITWLVSKGPNKILGLTWELVEEGVKRNYISFFIDFLSKVTLVCHERSFEIRVSKNCSQLTLHDLCSHVQSVILYSLKTLYKQLIPQIAFQCLCSRKSSSSIDHLCVLTQGHTVHFLCERSSVDLIKDQKVWLGKVKDRMISIQLFSNYFVIYSEINCLFFSCL